MPSARDIKAGEAYVELAVRDNVYHTKLAKASRHLKTFGAGVAATGAVFASMGGAIVGALTAAVFKFSEMGDALGKMSARTGVAASTLAELGFAAEQGGSNIEDVEKGLRRMQRTIQDANMGMASALDAFAELNIEMRELNSLNPEGQFQLIADALAGVTDATKRAAVAQMIFGRSGTQLLPMLSTLREVREEARQRGLVPSDQAVADAEAINDAFNRIRRTIMSVVFEVGAALAPMLLPALEVVAKIVTATIHWVKANGQLVRMIAIVGGTLLVVGTAVAGLGVALIAAGAALGGLAAALPVLATIGPAVAIGIAALGALSAAAAFAYITMQNFNISVRDLWNWLKVLPGAIARVLPGLSMFSGHFERLTGFIGTAAAAIRTATGIVVEQGRATARAALNNFQWRDSIDEVTDALSRRDEMLDFISRGEKSRARLVAEFATPEERAAEKRREIIAAMTQVNNQRLTGFIPEEQARKEMHALRVALERLDASERERLARMKPGATVEMPKFELPEMPVADAVRQAATVTFSGASLLASAQGGAGGPVVRGLAKIERVAAETNKRLDRLIEKTGGVAFT